MDHGLKRFTMCHVGFIIWIDHILNRSTASDLNAWRMGNSIYSCSGFIMWYCSYSSLPAATQKGQQDGGHPKSTSNLIPLHFNRCKCWYKEISLSSRCDKALYMRHYIWGIIYGIIREFDVVFSLVLPVCKITSLTKAWLCAKNHSRDQRECGITAPKK